MFSLVNVEYMYRASYNNNKIIDIFIDSVENDGRLYESS